MIRGSAFLAAVALLVSIAVHLAGAALVDTQPQTQIEGGAPATAAQLGNSFQDVASGVQTPIEAAQTDTPQPPEDTVETVEPEELTEEPQPTDQTEQIRPETQTDQPVPSQTAQTTAAEVVTSSRPLTAAERPQPTETTPVPAPSQSAVAAPVQPAQLPEATVEVQSAPVVRLERLTPSLSATPSTQATQTPNLETAALKPIAPTPRATVEPLPQEVEIAPAEPTVLEALPDPENETATRLSARPILRPKAIEEAARARAPAPQPVRRATSTPRPNRQATQGQNQPRQRAGQSDGQRNANANASSQNTSRARPAGNAAITNYPGQVQRKINRTRRPSVRGRGQVSVSFRIARNGGLAALSVSRSSGNPNLDRAALDLVRRAAPFPAPPAGARTSYTLPFRW